MPRGLPVDGCTGEAGGTVRATTEAEDGEKQSKEREREREKEKRKKGHGQITSRRLVTPDRLLFAFGACRPIPVFPLDPHTSLVMWFGHGQSSQGGDGEGWESHRQLSRPWKLVDNQQHAASLLHSKANTHIAGPVLVAAASTYIQLKGRAMQQREGGGASRGKVMADGWDWQPWSFGVWSADITCVSLLGCMHSE
ncbi:hypothetical protein MGYG_08930 [Nannizzia gypsea CBS 118893]|uniref:Uncharacterized protein n=1 Tax=Arthroderma gypseum (strain ATCC MYA-4604 / CBS 118893) TaxID=535722 RepID=E5R0L4_ARTGP|nr:hypothetical protein MGYG_08930 [Nannizzia gypsea CBS 118893]EFQ98358.1 hypothetical protein MGYG_08930 [Nannizzia gypsea CBS 118893]